MDHGPQILTDLLEALDAMRHGVHGGFDALSETRFVPGQEQFALDERVDEPAQARHREINGTLNTYYCGAYWRNGFHEDGVVSALDAVAHFEEKLEREELYIRRAG